MVPATTVMIKMCKTVSRILLSCLGVLPVSTDFMKRDPIEQRQSRLQNHMHPMIGSAKPTSTIADPLVRFPSPEPRKRTHAPCAAVLD